ncbi:MAG: O-antigen ligase family protein [Actinobacteria bacterium]|nr:MAG: O-antigen ligase family protein [Actinomycetota bacterium]
MSVRSLTVGAPSPQWWRPLVLPAGWVGTALLALGTGAGAAIVATRFQNAAPLVLIALFVAPLLALAIVINPLVANLVVLATFPIGSIAKSVGPLHIQAVEVAIFVAAVVVVLRRLAVGRIPLPFAAPLGWAVALFLWTLISLFSAIDETLAIKVLFSLLGGIVCATVVLAGCRNSRDVRILLGGFITSGVVIGFITFSETKHLTGASASFSGAQVVSGRLQGAFDSPNQLGALCALMIPVAAALIFGARTARWRFVAGMALVLLLATLMLSLSRGAWVGVAVALLFMLVKLREARRLLLILAIPLAVVGFFTWSLGPTKTDVRVVGERARAITVLSPYDDRRVIYREAMREIRENPVLGVGPGGFPVASTRIVSESATLSYAHAHNLYLNWAAEVGVPSLVIIFGFAFALGFAARTASREARVRGDPRDRALVIGIGAALLTVLVQGAFDYVIPNPVVFAAFWTLVGALLVMRREALDRLSR